jgi:hypothetical protein
MLRRPRAGFADLTELTVVVYASRPTDAITGETVYTVTPNVGNTGANLVGQNQVIIDYGGLDRPNLRKGSWILDVSLVNTTPGKFATINGFFYQVASVTDTGASIMTVELETPLKSVLVGQPPSQPVQGITQLVVMENVITVLERGTNWRP